ncbi:hypothetical protein PHLGIDRAFT_18378 [Phlebiopsis gigantea 11061_1 CR5-6]|uniref:Uncharacterized protein n=1 Tax=Phlebiopsis gigantea (strain 11061_1 CR5-6) TaxID=745531 RepID=A0A0C3PS87_PHLG1|nr:hypothetical protein PHLGIDRAFT_18378 [Phlebiopsis gigantea 11061_1 CR5-6]
MAPAGHDAHPAPHAYDAGRAPHPQYAQQPAMGHGHSGPDSRPQTRNRPPTRTEGASPVIYQPEARQNEATSRRTPPERRTKGSDSASPMPLFTRQPLSLDRTRTSHSQA